MPCVYLPGPAPAVTVANKDPHNNYFCVNIWYVYLTLHFILSHQGTFPQETNVLTQSCGYKTIRQKV